MKRPTGVSVLAIALLISVTPQIRAFFTGAPGDVTVPA
jgi:hypothetical protein